MMRRFLKHSIALLLCLTLCFGLCADALAYTGVSNWAAAEVEAADELGIIPITLRDVPLNGTLNRYNLCKMAVALFERIAQTSIFPASINHFTDTKDADICAAYELGLVKGYPDGTFKPYNTITRQEFAKVLSNLLDILSWSEYEQVLSAFSDEAQVSNWAREATANMISLGVVNGSGGKLTPTATTSIEQACAMFLRTYRVLSREEGIEGPAEPVAEDDEPTYIGASNWAKESLLQMDLLGLLPQSIQTAVMTQPITRGQMCEIAVLTYSALMGTTPEAAETAFSDTDLPAVSQASSLGLVSGFPDGTFHPDELLTRQQFFRIADNLLKACGYEAQTDEAYLREHFTDVAQIGTWAYKPMARLVRMGIMKGDKEGKSMPTGGTTCEQGIAMMMRTYLQISDWCTAHPLKEIVGPLTSQYVAKQVVQLALSMVGKPYVWAGTDPDIGFDCSGLVYYVYQQYGYSIHRVGSDMMKDGISVSLEDIRPGDILIFAGRQSNSIEHVAIYIGDGQIVHARNPRYGVDINDMNYDTGMYLYAIRRIIY